MHTALLLDMAAGSFPERLAVGDVSYGALLAQAQAGAAKLSESGAETVAFLGLNGPTLPVAFFASALLGKPFAPLNYRLPDADLQRLVARTAPSVLIIDDDMLPRVGATPGVTILPRSAFEAAVRGAEAGESAEVEPDIAVLLFTSGTTGEPKAAVLRHRHLAAYVISTVEFMGAEEDEAALVSVPPYHIAGLSAVLTSIYGGRRLVYLPAFNPEVWVETAAAENITHAMVVPTMLGRILDVLEARGGGLPHLRALSYGGGRMPRPVIERALRLLPGVDFVNAYGLTETSSTIALLSPDDHRVAIASDDPAVQRRLASVGKPLPSLELEIRDPEGAPLPAGQVGEIHVRGEQVAGEYVGKSVIGADGWFPTKDSGWVDDDGYLFVEGRLDDVIVRGGENISPGEIEDRLRKHPMVADVAVIGLPDDQWGEKIAAVVVPANGAFPSGEDLTAWVRGELKSSKTPETWSFRTELPYNELGKLLRRVLKAELQESPETVTA